MIQYAVTCNLIIDEVVGYVRRKYNNCMPVYAGVTLRTVYQFVSFVSIAILQF